MPLSFGLPVGIIIILVGLILYYSTSYKKMAKIILGIGATLAILTVGAFILVMNSSM
ncbi:MAG: hypothetical protein ISR58_17450 [Anaerolineales bacterium]|nr:hypothetical protein [Chloroflexota bacterium]MBL6982963.1 hypothetical protein [Anaerolineales bacterium]